MRKYDLLIIGSGPGGMNAALYAKRSNLNVAIVEMGPPGGKLVNMEKIENWLGDISLGGAELALRMNAHIEHLGVKSIFGEVIKINEIENKIILKDGEEIGYKFLIIASGTSEKIPENVKGIVEYNHRGVSYCAICDGPLYKNQVVAVIGGGNSAIEEAAFLASVAKEVHIFVRNKIKAEQIILDELKNKNNVFFHMQEEITEIHGDGKVEHIKTNKGEYDVKAIFPYVGLIANSRFVEGTSIKTNKGFIIVDENQKTSVDNIYSIGDVNDKHIRQVTTAMSDGTIAAKAIINLI